ncbi:MAG: coproporphyrinogen III oxidase [Crocinitomicaceae bacterium]|nr:coproporphyrinogen III oxidase [Crocinitomicaceae bacterium]|tara:strand:- start:7427 stop:8557 length:1131 start_codon:yes stop_codon:yes gene_type:complete
MAGIYIHVPFCGHACTYCDFYFTTTLNRKETFLDTLTTEIKQRKEFLKGQLISTIYFGGGTPSQIEVKELESILKNIYDNYPVQPDVEITLECNPDDITKERAAEYKSIGINRLSVGIQSFHDKELKLLGRMHDGRQALNAVEAIRKAGFSNFNLDLIYGVPGSTIESWEANLNTIIDLEPTHISSYSLTIEPGTQLEYQVKKGRVKYPEEELVIDQFQALVRSLTNRQYDHYEISNFSLPGFESKHNTSYWKGIHYLGLGPSAHSYDGENRYINVASTKQYCELMKTGDVLTTEFLSKQDRFNEYLLTRLRTKWGVDLSYLQNGFPTEYLDELYNGIKEPIQKDHLKINNDHLLITSAGKLFADKIASDLFIVTE